MSKDEDSGLLNSWKQIAKYLGCDGRTARRWEKDRALPVHRLPGRGLGAVFAYRSEIDGWIRGVESESGLPGTATAGRASEIEHLRVPNSPRFQPEINQHALRTVPPSPEANVASAITNLVGRQEPSASLRGKGFREGLLRWGMAALFVAAGTLTILGLTARRPSGAISFQSASEPARETNADAQSPSSSFWNPEVLSVQFTGNAADLGMYLNGLGFGHPANKLPFTGNSNWLRVGDVSCFATAPGTCEAGYTGDDKHLTYVSWTNSQILLSHFRGAAPGDAIEVAVWNPQVQSRQAAAVWGGNVPPIRPGTPEISRVIFTGSGKNLHITLLGKNFGEAPQGVPGVGDTAFLEFGDYAFHSARVVLSTFFRAGYQSSSVVDCITLNYQSWADNRIEVAGFDGAYGQNRMVVRHGDPVSVELWNTKTHLATAWGGRIP